MRDQRFRLAILLLAINTVMLAGLFVLAIMGLGVGVEGVLYMAAGVVLGWGTAAVGFYFSTSEGSSRKTDMLLERPTGNPGDPVHVEEEPAP